MTTNQPKPPMLYLFSRGGATYGPFSAKELRAFATEGRLLPTDMVWKEGTRNKVLAVSIAGLFHASYPHLGNLNVANQAPPAPTVVATIAPSEPLLAEANPIPGDQPPLVRITYIAALFKRGVAGLFHGYQITAIIDDAIVSGRTILYPRLEEENFNADGLRKFLASTYLHWTIPVDSISNATLHGSLSDSLVSYRYNIDPLARLTINTPKRSHKVLLDRRDTGVLSSRLRWLLGDRFEETVTGKASSLRFVMLSILWYGLFLMFKSFSVRLGSPTLAGLIHAIAALGIVFGINYLINRRSSKTFPIEVLSSHEWPKMNRPIPCVQPFRSPVAGWALKLAAIAWLALMLGVLPRWVAGRLDEVVDPRDKIPINIPSLVFLMSIPSVVLLYLGNGLLQRGTRYIVTDDERKPILFLRSFALDGKTTFQPKTTLAAFLGVSGAGSLTAWFSERLSGTSWIFSLRLFQCVHPIRLLRVFFGIVADSTEQSLVRFLSLLGPVVAIGKPGERIAQAGAHREYVADDVWQDAVLKHMANCQFVVLQPGSSDGMKWEIDTVFQRMPLARILLAFASGPGMSDDYDLVKSHLKAKYNLLLPASVPFRNVPVMVWFDECASVKYAEVSYVSPWKWLFLGDAVDLEFTLSPFIKMLQGVKVDVSSKARAHGLGAYAGAWAIAVSWMFGLGLWLDLGRGDGNVTTDASADPRRGPFPAVMIPVHGRAVSYSLKVPIDWKSEPSGRPDVEHQFRTPSGGALVAGANSESEDFSEVVESVRAGEAEKLGDDGRIEIEWTKEIELAGTRFKQARLVAELRSGRTISVSLLAYSGKHGSLLILGKIVEAADTADERALLEEAMLSVRLPADPNEK